MAEDTRRAFILESFDARPALRDDMVEPDVGDHEVLVRVQASSVNPVDVFIAAGGLKEMAEHAAAGANVIAPALPEDHDHLRGLGVSELLDRNADLAAAVQEAHPDGVDALLDVVSRGRLASPLGAAGEGPGRFNVMAVPTPANLERLAGLLETGALRVPIQRTYRLEQAGEALQALPSAHTQGKLGFTIA